MLIKLRKWSCFEIRMQDEITIYRFIIVPLKGWNSSNIWEQTEEIKILFRKLSRKCLLSVGAESFVFQFATQQYKD
jgi:hypothetical protein